MDKFSKETRSRIMSSIRSRNTSPELLLRRYLFKMGLRYRIIYGKYKIDIAFPRHKIAVFVDGCFWHQCPQHSNVPKSNSSYWVPKLKKNVERDKERDVKLSEQGWVSLRFWEHEIREDVKHCASKVRLELIRISKIDEINQPSLF